MGRFAQTIENSHSFFNVGLDRTGPMSFLTGQDRTPKFAGQVLPDRTDPLLICTDFLKYPFWHLFQTEIKIDFKTN